MKIDTKLNKPIFIVGHARGGSTLMGAILNSHSRVGPKYLDNKSLNTENLKNYHKHLEFSEKLEQKDIWFKYFKGEDCFTHMGMEIYEDSLKLNENKICELINDLTIDLKEERFLSKAPTNSFRLKPILEIFPDCKIIIVLRKGEEVVASWGKRPYGFGKNISWGKLKIKKLSYLKGVNIFSKKWYEVIKVVEEIKNKKNVFILTYDDIVNNTTTTLKQVINFVELPFEEYLDEIKLKSDKNKWKRDLPFFFRQYLKLKVWHGNKKIMKLKRVYKA